MVCLSDWTYWVLTCVKRAKEKGAFELEGIVVKLVYEKRISRKAAVDRSTYLQRYGY